MKIYKGKISYLFLGIILMIFSFGCATSSPNAFIKTSAPIFILNKPNSKNVFVDFKDYDNSQTKATILKELETNGYKVVHEQSLAAIIVKGEVNYIKENTEYNTNGYIGFGFGFGSHGRRVRDFELGLNHTFFNDDFVVNKYDGQASLLLRIKDGKEFQNYSTNLNFETTKDVHSYIYAKKLFSQKIAQKVVEFLNFK